VVAGVFEGQGAVFAWKLEAIPMSKAIGSWPQLNPYLGLHGVRHARFTGQGQLTVMARLESN
jgi:hypothetical protein